MQRAFIFPGQGSQFIGMGHHLYENSPESAKMIRQADEIVGYNLSRIMFEGPEESLKETIHTQPAVFLHSMLIFNKRKSETDVNAVAGHSLGELTALVAARSLSFEDGLNLVKVRAEAMHEACEQNPSTMAAILGMDDRVVEEICAGIDGVVVPANYNCPGQLVISGTFEAIREAIEKCKENGARRAIELAVGGAFHSPLMESAREKFAEHLSSMELKPASIPVYQNIDGQAHLDEISIRTNLIDQIVNPVRWSDTISNMNNAGISEYVEIGGKGRVLAGMIRKISREVEIKMWSEND